MIEDVYFDGTGQISDSCAHAVNYGIKVDLSVLRSRGLEDAPNRVSIAVGERWTSGLPYPIKGDDGALEWVPSPGIQVGQGLGAGLVRMSGGQFTTAGEPLFAISGGEVSFQRAECGLEPPDETSIDQLFETPCEGSEGEMRRLRKNTQPGPATNASVCLGPYDDSAECRRGIDCSAGFLCVDESCVEATE